MSSVYQFAGEVILSDPSEFTLLAALPYGKWTCKDDRVVLFNRFYKPIWQRYPGKAVKPADPTEWVRDLKTQDYIYRSIYTEAERWKAGAAVLAEWGLPIPDKRTFARRYLLHRRERDWYDAA